MKKTYIKPDAEQISLNTYEVMQDLQIPVSGGTTPEESDAKKGFFDEENDDNMWDHTPSLWDN